MRQNLCSMKAPMIPSVRGLGNLHTAREPRESSKLAGKKEAQVQREESKRRSLREKGNFWNFIHILFKLVIAFICEDPRLTVNG